MKKSKKKHKTEVVGRDGELILVDADKTTLWGRLKDKLGMALVSAGAVVVAIVLIAVLAFCFMALLTFLLVIAAVLVVIALVKVAYEMVRDAHKQHRKKGK